MQFFEYFLVCFELGMLLCLTFCPENAVFRFSYQLANGNFLQDLFYSRLTMWTQTWFLTLIGSEIPNFADPPPIWKPEVQNIIETSMKQKQVRSQITFFHREKSSRWDWVLFLLNRTLTKHFRKKCKIKKKTGGDSNSWIYEIHCPICLVLIELFSVEVQNWVKLIQTEGSKKSDKNKSISKIEASWCSSWNFMKLLSLEHFCRSIFYGNTEI